MVILKGKKIILRPLQKEDAQDIYLYANDKKVVRWVINIPHPYPKKAAVIFIKKSIQKMKKKDAYPFGIIDLETQRVIGIVEIMKIDWKNKNFELGYWLGRKYWSKGIMTEAAQLALCYAFFALKLHRASARCFDKNVASARVMEKIGMKPEGRLREEKYRYGKWHNILHYGILKREFKRKYKGMMYERN
jgi:[ribosomal protein S5]-alanine N-acetyltransferase